MVPYISSLRQRCLIVDIKKNLFEIGDIKTDIKERKVCLKLVKQKCLLEEIGLNCLFSLTVNSMRDFSAYQSAYKNY